MAASRKSQQSKPASRVRSSSAAAASLPAGGEVAAAQAQSVVADVPSTEPEHAVSESTTTQVEMADAAPLPEFGKSAAAKGELIMTDMLETAKTYAEEAKTRMQSVFTDMSEKAKVTVAKSSKVLDELGDLTRGNLEAVADSSRIAAKGFESLGQDVAEFGRTSFERSSSIIKSFASVKSPAEFFQLQSELMSQAMDAFASETAKNSEKMLKLAGEISQPISTRVSVVTDKFKSFAA